MGEPTAVFRLAKAIGYPTEIPPDASVFTFAVDDYEVVASEADNRLVLRLTLARADGEPVALAPLAGYAAGRMLREEAVLAWDPEAEAPILWQDVPAGADDAVLRRLFEVFASSCDWWRARLGEAESVERIPEMMIMP